MENGILKPLAKGSMPKRFAPVTSCDCILFPYKIANGKTTLMKQAELKSHYPNAFAYLKKFERLLRSRENNKFDDENWYRFSRNQGMSYIDLPKILTPDICQKGQSTLDLAGEYLTTTTVYGVIPVEKKNMMYLLAVLNSSLLNYYIKNTGSILRGGFYRYKTAYLRPFPIATLKENKIKEINSLVDEMLSSNRKLARLTDKKIREELKAGIELLEKEIDKFVYEVYGVTKDEQKIVQQTLDSSKTE